MRPILVRSYLLQLHAHQSFSVEIIITQNLLLCEGYTPWHLTLGASIVFENLLAITSHLVHAMDKSLNNS